jgi:hypothetical protein
VAAACGWPVRFGREKYNGDVGDFLDIPALCVVMMCALYR